MTEEQLARIEFREWCCQLGEGNQIVTHYKAIGYPFSIIVVDRTDSSGKEKSKKYYEYHGKRYSDKNEFVEAIKDYNKDGKKTTIKAAKVHA